MIKPIKTIISACLFASVALQGWTSAVSAEESRQPQNLQIDALTFNKTAPVPGEVVEAHAVIRNTSGQAAENATAQFYQDNRKLGAPVQLGTIAPDSVAHITAPFRPNSAGRYSINVVVKADASAVAGTEAPEPGTGASVLKSATLVIDSLPQWWSRLDAELASADQSIMPANQSVMNGLEGHALCDNNTRTGMVLQQHGQSLMDGISALPGQPDNARKRFADAVFELSKFAEMLYCVDFAQLEYWDRAIAGFWRSMADKPESDLTFDEAVIAMWNPALLVVDAVQITGHSEIIVAFQDLKPRVIKALALYPADTYGAAWLDAFGTGQLVRHGGDAALENLREIVLEPKLLGLGLCPLTAHANKAQINEPCFERIAQVTAACNVTDLASVLAGLHEAGMMTPLLHGNFSAKASQAGAAPQPSPVTQTVTVKADELGHFGNRLIDTIPDLCANLKAMGKAASMQGMADAVQGIGPGEIGGCGFAMVEEHLKNASRTAGDRALQCLKGMGTQSPKSPLPSTTEVRFPSACAVGQDTDAEKLRQAAAQQYVEWLTDPNAQQTYSRSSTPTQTKVTNKVDRNDGSSESITETRQGKLGPLTNLSNTRTDSNGQTVFEGSYDLDPKTGQMTKSVETQKHADGTTTRTTTTYDKDGNTNSKTETFDKNGKKTGETSETSKAPSQTGRPAGPGEGGCPETAAQARAQALFNCMFAEEMTEVSGRAGLAPQIIPLTVGGRLPQQCDALDPGAVWGSTTGAGVTDPVPWSVTGGPALFRQFTPQIDGVIDPPREWTSIPRAGRNPPN